MRGTLSVLIARTLAHSFHFALTSIVACLLFDRQGRQFLRVDVEHLALLLQSTFLCRRFDTVERVAGVQGRSLRIVMSCESRLLRCGSFLVVGIVLAWSHLDLLSERFAFFEDSDANLVIVRCYLQTTAAKRIAWLLL